MILLVDAKNENIDEARRIFHKMGIPAFGATLRRVREAVKNYPVKAVLFLSVSTVEYITGLVEELHALADKLLFYAMTDEKQKKEILLSERFSFVFSTNENSTVIVETIEAEIEKSHHIACVLFAACGLFLGRYRRYPSLYGFPFPVGATERLILRVLMQNYPKSVPTAVLEECCLKRLCKNKYNAIQSHICRINLKTKSYRCKALIDYKRATGYYLID